MVGVIAKQIDEAPLDNDDRQLFIENGLVKIEKTGLLAGSGINLNKFQQRMI